MNKRFVIFLFLFSVNQLIGQSFLGESSKIAFSFYDKVVSPVKSTASACQFYPSCSEYSRQAIKMYGFSTGMALTCDRFMRCSGGHTSDRRYPNFGNLYFDPPENNYVAGEGNLWTTSSNINYLPNVRFKDELSASYFELDSSISNLSFDNLANEDFQFEKSLFKETDYNSSILELKRKRFKATDSILLNKIDLLIAANYFSLGRTDKTTDIVLSLSERINVFDRDFFYFRYVLADQRQMYAWSSNYCRSAFEQTNDSSLAKFLLYVEFKRENFSECIKVADDFVQYNPNLKIAYSNAIGRYSSGSYKSPFLAGLMSTVLPGSGYVYAGSLKEGLSAFLVNGLLGAGIYALFKNDNVGSGILLSAVSASFYFGNIIGSVNSAKLSNQQQIDIIHKTMRSELELDYYYSTSFLYSLFD